MNRFSREYVQGGRNVGQQQQQIHRRNGAAISGGGGGSREGDERLDLFSKIQHNKTERKGIGSPYLGRGKTEDLFCADTGKSDYDWLLTPPGTPTLPSSLEVIDHQLTRATARSNSNTRPASAGKASRFSASHTENNAGARLTRSSSTTARSSISNAYSTSSYVSNNRRASMSNIYTSSSHISSNARTSVLNTSTASVTSKPSPTFSKPSRSTPSRSPTPVKAQPSAVAPRDKPRPVMQNTRPATPTSRPRTPCANKNPYSDALGVRSSPRPSTPCVNQNSSSNVPGVRSNSRPLTPCVNQNTSSNVPGIRSNSRPSTPARRAPSPAQTPSRTRSNSVGRVSELSSRSSGHMSRPSSPVLHGRAPVQALPERALSAGRQRPGKHDASSTRSSSIIHEPKSTEKKMPSVADRRLVKPATSPSEPSGFGRSISKKSMDMALKHMDIKHSMGSVPGASVFPRSIRSATTKGQITGFSTDQGIPALDRLIDNKLSEANGLKISSRDCNGAGNGADAVKASNKDFRLAGTCEFDVSISSRYDAILLKEGHKNMNWLHSIEDAPDRSPLFDHRFAMPLPEPLGFI